MIDFFIWGILIVVGIINIFLIIGIFGFFRGAFSGAPFVPTRNKMVNKMIELAGNIPNKNVFDLGCGDGRLVFASSKKGANAIGIEISYFVYLIALTRKFFTRSTGTIYRKSLWDQDISDADIIFVYLLPAMMKKFETEKIPTLKKGCKIISNGFSLPSLVPIYEEKMSGIQGRVLVYET